MTSVRGLLTRTELEARVKAGDIETVVVVFTDHYGRFMGKRFDAEFFLDEGVEHGTHACDYLLTVDMEMNPVAGYRFTSWERGYGDFHLVPDLDTLRLATWLPKTALVLCDVHDVKTEERVTVAPRSILRAQVEKLAAAGFTAQAASELEYYLYRDSYRDAAKKAWRGLEPAGWYLEDYHALQGTREEPFTAAVRRHLRDSGVPVENSKGEWGLGQHELNVRYAEALVMADRHAIYKQCLKEVADALGMSVTFMAKPAADQAGSSCHIHMSLWNGKKSAFPGTQKLSAGDAEIACTDTFRWFLGGWIAHAGEVMPFYAPTVNSYKRYQSGSWAPTRMAWSYDNRTAGFRIVGSGQSLRIECRIPGADCNPYLGFAASIASGLDGIENKIEPPPMFTGDMYSAKDLPEVPTSLRVATDAFERSKFVRAAFGGDVVDHYVHFFRNEEAQYEKAVTDWERQRYFERI
jgi:glutamine synthetase